MSARVRVVALVARDEWSSELSRELAARDLPCARVGARRPCEDAIATLRPDAVVISRAVLDADGDGALAAVVARARTCGARVLLLASWKLLVAAVAPPEVDRLLLEPIAAADVAAVIARELAAAAPPPRATAAAAALAGTSLLGRERSPALHDLVGRLVEAFGARQGGGFFHDRDWIELGADPPSEHRRFIRQVVFAAAAGGAPLIAAMRRAPTPTWPRSSPTARAGASPRSGCASRPIAASSSPTPACSASWPAGSAPSCRARRRRRAPGRRPSAPSPATRPASSRACSS